MAATFGESLVLSRANHPCFAAARRRGPLAEACHSALGKCAAASPVSVAGSSVL